jgi:hypothetical protein
VIPVRALRLLLAGALAAVMVGTGCAPLYFPLIPDTVEAPEPVIVTGESVLEFRDGGLIATVHFEGTSKAGWLSFQWYGPLLGQVASDSVWIEPDPERSRLVIGAPATVAMRDGRWRLVISFEGTVLRQLDVLVGTED